MTGCFSSQSHRFKGSCTRGVNWSSLPNLTLSKEGKKVMCLCVLLAKHMWAASFKRPKFTTAPLHWSHFTGPLRWQGTIMYAGSWETIYSAASGIKPPFIQSQDNRQLSVPQTSTEYLNIWGHIKWQQLFVPYPAKESTNQSLLSFICPSSMSSALLESILHAARLTNERWKTSFMTDNSTRKQYRRQETMWRLSLKMIENP